MKVYESQEEAKQCEIDALKLQIENITDEVNSNSSRLKESEVSSNIEHSANHASSISQKVSLISYLTFFHISAGKFIISKICVYTITLIVFLKLGIAVKAI